jgi:hypothetical protein
MHANYFLFRRPRREPFYLAAGCGLLVWYLMRQADLPAYAFVGLGAFMTTMIVLALRKHAVGMEIRDGIWSCFVGKKTWSVPLGEVGAVRVVGSLSRPRELWLRLRDGRVLRLPAALKPDLRALERALAWRGIPVEG